MSESKAETVSKTVVLDVDPGALVVAANVRRDVKLTPEFVASVKEHGVLVPILVQEGLDSFEVVDGQRRMLAAVEAGVKSVPVVVAGAQVADAELVVEQLVVNEQRQGLSGADQAAAVKQLELFGMKPAQIAKKLGTKKDQVEKTLALADSELGAQLFEKQLGLDHAAAILEFEGHPAIVEQLTNAALDEPRSFEHYLADARVQKEQNEQEQALVAELTSAGYTVVQQPNWQERDQMRRPSELFRDRAYKEPLAKAGERPAADIPGLCVYLVQDWVRPEGDGEWERAWVPSFVVVGWKEAGFFQKGMNSTDYSAAAKSEAQQEEEKAARRRVLANNKAWPAATGIRVQWITETLLKAKKLPTTAQTMIALKLTSDLPKDAYGSGVAEAFDWLGAEQTDHRTSRAVRYLEQHPADGERLNLAIALSSVELALRAKDAWRYYEQPKLVRYLELLGSWGYGLSELEQELVAAGKPKRARKGSAAA